MQAFTQRRTVRTITVAAAMTTLQALATAATVAVTPAAAMVVVATAEEMAVVQAGAMEVAAVGMGRLSRPEAVRRALAEHLRAKGYLPALSEQP